MASKVKLTEADILAAQLIDAAFMAPPKGYKLKCENRELMIAILADKIRPYLSGSALDQGGLPQRYTESGHAHLASSGKTADDPDAMNEKRAEEDAKLAANVREATIEECAKIARHGAKDYDAGDTNWHQGFRYAANAAALEIESAILALSATGEPKR